MSRELLIQRVAIEPSTPQLTKTMSQAGVVSHREHIAFEVLVILDGYWEKQPPADVKAGILADWCDSLQDWSREQVVWALRKWRNDNPDKRPNPGHILGIMKDKRGQRIAAEKYEARKTLPPPPPRVTADRTAEILAEIGFKVNRIEGTDQ